MLPIGIASLIVAMGVAWIATPAAIRVGHWLRAVDVPGARKIHAEPIPRIGGLAVFAGFVGGLAFAAFASGALFDTPQVSVYWRGLALAATGMLVVGLIDDIRGLSFLTKFAAQIASAVFVWFCGFRIDVVVNPIDTGGIELGWLSLPVTVLWIVGITNAINLIDGLDGLATGIALIITCTVAAIAFARAQLGVTAASVALAGALIGFLRFNFNPARIFLGDSGSMFLGFVLAVTSVRGSQKGPTAVAILVPLLVLGVPLLDTGLAVIRRLYRLVREARGADAPLFYFLRNLKHIFLPDRGHIHHRLLDMGLSHRGAVGVLYAVGLLFAAAAFALVLLRSPLLALMLGGLLTLLMAAYLLLLYFRFGREGSGGSSTYDADPPQPLTAPPRSQTQSR